MTKAAKALQAGFVAFSLGCSFATAAYADVISPGIHYNGSTYSKEKPDASFYGTGTTGRMNEAMNLRFFGEQDTADSKFDEAIRKLSKAVQLDPGDPAGHVLLARAMSAKFLSISPKSIKLPEVERAINEWKMLWRHDADYTEQWEAKMQVLHLTRLAHAVKKEMKREAKHPSERPSAVAVRTEPQESAE